MLYRTSHIDNRTSGMERPRTLWKFKLSQEITLKRRIPFVHRLFLLQDTLRVVLGDIADLPWD